MSYPPHNPDDEPRSEPFRPVSYDLAPEFGTQAPPAGYPTPPAGHPGGYSGQPAATPPGYPGPPQPAPAGGYPAQGGGYPPQGGFGPPTAYPVSAAPHAYQPVSAPAFAQPPGAPIATPAFGQPPATPAFVAAPPTRKKGRGWKITLSVLGAVLLLCGIATGVFMYPYIKESAHVSAPATLPGNLTKSSTDAAGQLEDTVETALRDGTDELKDVATGVYTTPGDVEKVVVLAAATGTFLSPGSEADSAFRGFESGGSGKRDVSSPRSYAAGSMGGTVKCADGQAGAAGTDKTKFAMCVWADHGSIGLVLFFGRTADESAPLFIQIREAVVKRG